jgi:hypothetical protein
MGWAKASWAPAPMTQPHIVMEPQPGQRTPQLANYRVHVKTERKQPMAVTILRPQQV